jgi:hypothetical protein
MAGLQDRPPHRPARTEGQLSLDFPWGLPDRGRFRSRDLARSAAGRRPRYSVADEYAAPTWTRQTASATVTGAASLA